MQTNQESKIGKPQRSSLEPITSLPRKQVSFNRVLPPSRQAYTDKFMNKLVHKLGHDLRSSMFVVRSYSQLLQRTKEPARLDRGLRMMEESTDRMERLINSMVELIDVYTLPEPGKELVLIENAFKKAKTRLYNQLEAVKPTIHFNFKSFPVVRFAPSYLTDIFYELIDNAIKHNEDHSNLQIYVSTYKQVDKLVLEISDNGKGIDKELGLDKVLQPFYSCTDTKSYAGVGLSKVQAIAKVCGGSFEIENSMLEGLVCRYQF